MTISAFKDENGNSILDCELTPEREAKLMYKTFSEEIPELTDKLCPKLVLENIFQNFKRDSLFSEDKNIKNEARNNIIAFGKILEKYSGPKMNLPEFRAYDCLTEVKSYFNL